MESKMTSKRIVSKREYAVLIGKREALRWGSVGLAVVVAICVLCTVGFIMVGLQAGAVAWTILCFLIAILCMAAAWGIKQAAENAMKKALAKLDAIPLNRANIADLPVPDTLVRASSEPIEEQQAVLLRAASQGQERHEEQLLRAATDK